MTRLDPPARRWIAAAAAAAGIFCAFVVLIPIAEQASVLGAPLGRLALQPTCHQIPDRSLDLGAGHLPVCARCSGLYAGGFLGLLLPALLGRRFRPRWRWVLLAAAPSVIDFGLGLIGLPDLPNWPRLAAALVPGLLLGLVLADAIRETVELNTQRTPRSEIT